MSTTDHAAQRAALQARARARLADDGIVPPPRPSTADEWLERIYRRLWWVAFWLCLIAVPVALLFLFGVYVQIDMVLSSPPP